MRVTLLSLLMLAVQGSRPPDIPFRMHAIDGGASETAAVADVNRDGRLDIISGQYWYEAPALDLTKKWTPHRFRELGFSNQYIDNFSDLVVDVDGDDYPDVASVSWFAKRVAWWRNPGKAGGDWKLATSTATGATTSSRHAAGSRRPLTRVLAIGRSIAIGKGSTLPLPLCQAQGRLRPRHRPSPTRRPASASSGSCT